MPVKKTRFQQRHWDAAAEFILGEYRRRKNDKNRAEKERIWDEVDRQVEMRPKPRRKVEFERKSGWFPDTELPLQATALEVLQADARRLTFPRNSEWYLPHSEISDDFVNKFQERRETHPMIGDEAQPMKLDQETADVLVKATIDHFHTLFNFRDAIDFNDVEALKYGTYVGRIVEAQQPVFTSDFRGVSSTKRVGPAVIPVSVRNHYLDDSPQAVMMEGVAISPADIREYWQRRDDLVVAAKSESKGWIGSQVARIELKDPAQPIHMLEFEGDLVIPRSKDHLFLPNSVVTVAIGEGGPRVVRFRENKNGFRSYYSGVYAKENLKSPYGTSPLMKGQPIQELATLMANSLAASVALSAQPPGLWDATDSQLTANGGPVLEPNAMTPADDPDRSVNILREWNISDTGIALQLLLSQYEDITGVTAPRRGAQTKSHTTAFAVDVENTRGLVRTDDYVQAKENGPLRSILHREYAIIKKTMASTPVYIGTGGIEGFVNISKEDLPDNVTFEVIGSAGPATERERAERRQAALQGAAAMSEMSAQQGGPVLNFAEAMKETLGEAFANPDRFITTPDGQPNAAPGVGGVPGGLAMVQDQGTQ